MQVQPDDWLILPFIFPAIEEAKKESAFSEYMDSEGYVSLMGLVFIHLTDLRDCFICGMVISAGSTKVNIRGTFAPTFKRMNLPTSSTVIMPGATFEVHLQGPALEILQRVWLSPAQGFFNRGTVTLWVRRAASNSGIAPKGVFP